jgi:hypothetical protein
MRELSSNFAAFLLPADGFRASSPTPELQGVFPAKIEPLTNYSFSGKTYLHFSCPVKVTRNSAFLFLGLDNLYRNKICRFQSASVAPSQFNRLEWRQLVHTS